MDEMNLLTAMRDEVPLAAPSPAATRLFRAGLVSNEPVERVGATRPRLRSLPGSLPGLTDASGRFRRRWLVLPGALAVGLAAALVVTLVPQSPGAPAGPVTVDPANGMVMSAQLLADIAGKAALSQPPVRPDQWVYQKLETYSANPPGAPSYAKLPGKPVQIQTQWTLADGGEQEWGPVNGHMAGGLVLNSPNAKVNEADEKILSSAATAYANLGSLPKNPAALVAYFTNKYAAQYSATYVKLRSELKSKAARANLPQPSPTFWAEETYSEIQQMLSSEILPPSLTAELYHALADVPGVIAKKDVKLVTGQYGVGFIFPQSAYSINEETILSPTTYQYLGQATWSSPPYVWKKEGNGYSGPNMINEQVLLAQAVVSGPGKLP